MQSPRCILCSAPVDGDEGLRAHLAEAHGLRDDPGTCTHLDDLDLGGPVTAPAGGAHGAGGGSPILVGGPAAAPASHVHDPAADDERWRPVTIGVGGVLLLLALLVAFELLA